MVGRRSIMRFVLSFLAGMALFVGCGGELPDSKLPLYGERMPDGTIRKTGHLRELFDDVIEPRAVGMDLSLLQTPRSDPILRERTQVGDAVIRVRVQTVTQSGSGPSVRHQLMLDTMEKLAGSHPPPETFSVSLDDASPSIGIVRSLES